MAEKASNWTKLEVCTQIGILIFAIVAVVYSVNASYTANNNTEQANKLTEQALQLQNTTSNFEPSIINYLITADLQNISIANGTNVGYGTFIEDSGNLNMSLVVITPHSAIISFSGGSSDIIFNPFIPSNSNDTIMDPKYAEQSFAAVNPYIPTPLEYGSYLVPVEAFVQPGVTQVNFTMPIFSAGFVLNPLLINNKQMPFADGTIGDFQIKVHMLDAQTNSTKVWDFNAPVFVYFTG